MAVRDWDIPRGADTVNAAVYSTRVSAEDPLVPVDLTDWTARSQIRDKETDEVWVEFLSSSLTGPRIFLGASGEVEVILPSATTEEDAWASRKKGRYDVELVSPTGEVKRFLSGVAIVHQDVTR